MKTKLPTIAALCACATLLFGAPAQAQLRPLRYAVSFNDGVVATQTVSIAHADGLATVSTSFETLLHVFLARHVYSESLSVTFREDGGVERLHSVRVDGANRIEVVGEADAESHDLRIVRTDRDGTETTLVRREDYDFHSLILYGTSPSRFLPPSPSVRILDVASGRVLSADVRAVAQSETTPERQNVASTRLTWTIGPHVSYSWHPEHLGEIPGRYVRQTDNGTYTFVLRR